MSSQAKQFLILFIFENFKWPLNFIIEKKNLNDSPWTRVRMSWNDKINNTNEKLCNYGSTRVIFISQRVVDAEEVN